MINKPVVHKGAAAPAIAAGIDEPANANRRRGRPARLSAEAVVEAALKLLETASAEDFTMTRIAQALGTTTMALYRYFPSREALLETLADNVFAQFDMRVKPGAPWQETLFAWQWALKSHFEQHHTLHRLMAWGGRLSGPWLRVQMPVIETLHAAGLRGRRLHDAVTWFMTDTAGLLTIGTADELLSFDGRGEATQGFRQLQIGNSLDYLNPRQREIMQTDMVPFLATHDVDAMIEFGFRNLISGIERLVAGEDVAKRR